LYTVLSGYVMPLELFPKAARRVVDWLPFRQMLAFPVENMIGLVDRHRALRELGLQWAYVALFALLADRVWRAGIRRFAAFGG
jgi:ABC-2 type transport system permease protein